MNKFLLFIIASVLGSISLPAQTEELIEKNIQAWDVESKLRFLSSDELEGRRAGERGNDIAARFMADHFKALGLKTAPLSDSYFQEFSLLEFQLPSEYQLTLEGDIAISPDDLLILTGDKTELSTKLVFVEYGMEDEEAGTSDYEGLDLQGKIAVCLAGTSESTNAGPRTVYQLYEQKREIAKKHGAVGLIEITQFRFPFSTLKRYINNQVELLEEEETDDKDFIYIWTTTNSFAGEILEQIKSSTSGISVDFMSSGTKETILKSKNVIGIIEGTDPELKNEYLMLSAHFDHVGMGVKANASRNYVNGDSIYNGARDNAIGTTALLIAAQTLSANPPKRSVAIIGWNAEEMGLLGSKYFAENPTIPLDQFIYNLNVDGPGYNSTEHISIQGSEKTNMDDLLEKAIREFGLEVMKNPAPEQKGYYRSDNITFARLGIPAIAMHQGVTQFDEELQKYYHQAIDEADSVDMPYAHKFCQIYSYAARLIANSEIRPYWVPGDEFEEAAEKLYNQ